jgi:stage V sporulation protein D (sporulation-specific penicillin-binding protein)
MKKQRSAVQKQVNRLALVMMVMMGFIVLRYGWLQLVEGNELSERMKNQVGHDFAIQSPRGTILDRNGRELAVSTMTKSLYIDPAHVKDPQAVAEDLAPLIGKVRSRISSMILQ